MNNPQANSNRHEVRRVLMITLALNILVALSKVGIGLVTGALAITADGFHSFVDGSANVVALVANRIADRPPDADHPYGHRRFETIAALGIGVFLLFTAFEIVSSALGRLGGAGEKAEVSPLSFVVMIGTLVVNLFVTRFEKRAGQRLRSELLIADAAHTGTDVYVTLSVLVSMVLVALFGWLWVDTAAALVIVVLILRAAWDVLRKAGGVLVDTAPYAPEQLETWIHEIPSVERVVRVRSRGAIDSVSVDIDVQVPPATTADHTAAITNAIREKLAQNIEGLAEVEVHFVPQMDAPPDYALQARACADALGLATHEVRVSNGEQGKIIEMHVEVPPGETLGAAHERVSQLEQRVQTALPNVAEVITHIEPALTTMPVIPEAPDETAKRLKAQAFGLLQGNYPDADWHHLRVYPADDGFTLTLHVALPAQITVDAAHRIAEAAETMLRAKMPDFERVTIHTEPPENTPN